MRKIKFTYTKEDKSTSEREVVAPKFLKEHFNYLNSFDKESVKYVQGYELDKNGLTNEEISDYEDMIEDYVEMEKMTIEGFFVKHGFDPKKVKQKIFKKENISKPIFL